ncbi:methyl-accepting chemotaxis protein [Campylobacterota bacterium]|nr:methyl-accepting chemotaxis protein [Campylobacterota bacterium]
MFKNFSVSARLFFMAIVSLVLTCIVGVFGFSGVVTMDKKIDSMYDASLVPAVELGSMNGALGKIVADLLLTFQHNPKGTLAAIHDHPVQVHLESAEMWKKMFETHWANFMKTPLGGEEQKLADIIDRGYKNFISEAYNPVVARAKRNDFSDEGVGILLGGFVAHAVAVETTLAKLLEMQEDLGVVQYDNANETYAATRNTLVIVTLVSIALTLAIAFNIILSITKPLIKVQETMSDIEKTGDFRKRIDVDSADEVGTTAKTINHLLGALQDTFKTISHSTAQLDTASSDLATVSQRVARGSEKTSDSSSDMAASVEQMTASISQVGENAKETSKNAENMMELSQTGVAVVHKTVAEMQQMAEAVKNSSDIITELGRESEQISGIVQTIKDVADQTNLLALNAAIEAARAGEQGRGFAVVADEIRKLAERTTSATTEIAAMISAIQESSHSAVESMGHAASRVDTGVTLANQAGDSINNIQQGAQEVQVRVADITAALSEQSGASHQIAAQVEKVAQATDENAEAAKSSSQAAINIAALAKAMREAMAKFTV